MTPIRRSVTVHGKTFTLETGRMAKQAAGSVLVTCGDSVVLVTANIAPTAREGVDFFPLTCEYRPRYYASGRIPGNFFRRETRPGELGTLICRLMDRPTRPLFPKGFRNETQIYAMPVSHDREEQTDILSMLGTSACLALSPAPFEGPYGAVRVGRIEGEFVMNPTRSQMENSDLDMVVAATRDAISMVEAGADGVSEDVMLDAIDFAREAILPLIELQEALVEVAGADKWPAESYTQTLDEALWARVQEAGTALFEAAFEVEGKLAQYAARDKVRDDILATFEDEDERARAKGLVGKLEKKVMRTRLIERDLRADGRSSREIRKITVEVGVLPKAHGSALFTRGETQTLVGATLGTRTDEQKFDEVWGSEFRTFMLHYNFPPFCVGEVRRITGPKRREIGHGALARRAVEPTLPKHEDFPYTTRVVSDVLESNGSSSMASVCGASLALMDAGVPVSAPVAGIAMGLVWEGDSYVVLSDITGTEDHLGDMDFKVAGPADSITALQMDNKLGGITREVLAKALDQARDGRQHILGEMSKVLGDARTALNGNAPRITTIKISRDKIRDVIGPGGKTIRNIVETTGAQLDVSDDGTVRIASPDMESSDRAIKMVKQLTQEPEIGKLYLGLVRKVTDFGAFVEIFPGTDGLVHISQLANERVKKVTDVVNEGDEVLVRCIDIDRSGKIRLSRKAAMGEALG